MKLPITHEVVNRTIQMHSRYGGGAMVLPVTYKNTEVSLAARAKFTAVEEKNRTDEMSFAMVKEFVAGLLVSEPKFISSNSMNLLAANANAIEEQEKRRKENKLEKDEKPVEKLNLEDFLESYDEFPSNDKPLNERAFEFFNMGDAPFQKVLSESLMVVFLQHEREAEGKVPPIFTLSSN